MAVKNNKFWADFTTGGILSVCLFVAITGLYKWNFSASILTVPSPRFADLSAVTHTASCITRGGWEISEVCDPHGRPFNYPPTVAQVFAFMDLGKENTEQIGNFLTFVFSVAIGALSVFVRPSKKRYANGAYWFLIGVSPPIQYLFWTGNIEVVPFLFALVSVFLARFTIASSILLALAGVIKLTPIFAGLSNLVKASVTRWLVWLGVLVLGMGSYFTAIPQLLNATPKVNFWSIGAGVAVSDLRNNFGHASRQLNSSDMIIGAVAFTALILIMTNYFAGQNWWKAMISEIFANASSARLWLIGLGVLAGTYSVAPRFFYGWIWVIFLFGAALTLEKSRKVGLLSVMIPALLLCWASYPSRSLGIASNILTFFWLALLISITLLHFFDKTKHLIRRQ